MRKKDKYKSEQNEEGSNFDEVERVLIDLGRRLELESVSAFRHTHQEELCECGESPEWRGGGVLITSDLAWEPQGFADSSKLAVRTQHAVQLTWLMLEVRDVFAPWISFANKFGFYGSLAEAALKHLSVNQPEADDPRPLLRAVLSCSFERLNLLRERGFIPENAKCVLHLRETEGRQKRIDLQTGEEGM